MQTCGCQEVALEDVDGLADIIACGAQYPTVVGGRQTGESAYKLPDGDGRTPAVHGETEADGFVFITFPTAVERVGVGDIEQFLAGRIADLLSCPTSVSRTGEIIYHVAKITLFP